MKGHTLTLLPETLETALIRRATGRTAKIIQLSAQNHPRDGGEKREHSNKGESLGPAHVVRLAI